MFKGLMFKDLIFKVLYAALQAKNSNRPIIKSIWAVAVSVLYFDWYVLAWAKIYRTMPRLDEFKESISNCTSGVCANSSVASFSMACTVVRFSR